MRARRLRRSFLGLAYMREQGIPVTIARLFNTIGPRQSSLYGMVVPRFVQQALTGAPITVYGAGDQRRCFMYVGDMVEMLLRLGRTPAVAGEIINLGNDSEICIKGLAQLVRTVAGSSSEIVHADSGDVYGAGFDEPSRRLPCLEKMRRLLGPAPVTPLVSAIESVVEYERQSIASLQPTNRSRTSTALILMYHNVAPRPLNMWYVSPQHLREHMAYVMASGYRFDTLAALGKDQGRVAVLTFDDAYENVLRHAVPVLDEFRIPGNIFVPVDFVGE